MNEEPSTQESAPESIPEPSTAAIKCDQCDATFPNQWGMRVHKSRKHGSPAKMAKWNRNIAKAQQKPEVNKKNLAARGLKPRKPRPEFKCDTCGDEFATVQALGLHKFRAHSKAKKQTREEKLARMREYAAKYRAKAKAGKISLSPSKDPEYQRQYAKAYHARRKAEKAQAQEQAAQPSPQSNGPAQSSTACPNYCPNCGFGLAAVSVAITLPNR